MFPEKSEVLVSGYYFAKPFGFGRFTRELLAALDSGSSEARIRVAVPSDVPTNMVPSYNKIDVVRLPSVNLVLWEQLIFPIYAAWVRAHTVHHPCNTKQLWRWPGVQVVWTLHDLIFLDRPGSVQGVRDKVLQEYTRFIFRFGRNSSDSVVGVSETTTRALKSEGLWASRIYNTIDDFILRSLSLEPATGHSGPYLLHRGGTSVHRNTARVVEAHAELRRRWPELQLLILGYGSQGDSSIASQPGVEILPRLTDAEVATVYRGAACVVVPSLAEGFGLPILEAFGFDAPVVTSNIDPMAEVLGKAGVAVDPFNVEDIVLGVSRILEDEREADRLRAAGRARRSVFSGAEVARSYAALYSRRAVKKSSQ